MTVKQLSHYQHFDPEAEQAVLGAILFKPEALCDVLTVLSPKDFGSERHRKIFKGLIELDKNQTPIDLVSLTGYFKDKGELDETGGPVYLAGLSDNVATAANIMFYAKRVKTKASLRELKSFSDDISASLQDQIDDPGEFRDWIEARLFEIGQEFENTTYFETIPERLDCEVGVLQQIQQQKAQVGLSTGYFDLDDLMTWKPGELTILAARPSMGKTNLALNFALRSAKTGAAINFTSLEMANSPIARRILAIESRVDACRIFKVWLGQEHWAAIKHAKTELHNLKMTLDFRPTQSIMEIRSQARWTKIKHGLDLLIIDYLQLIKSYRRGRSREEEVAETSRGLKALAGELKIPILVIAQLNRKCEERPNKRPKLSDLRESGAIEQDADAVLFLYRDEYYRGENANEKGVAELNIAKNRNGRTGMVKLAYQEDYLRFEDHIEHAEQN
ncbi:MAG: replicative DNA helicase [Desulfobacteraceae bacterium]